MTLDNFEQFLRVVLYIVAIIALTVWILAAT